MRAPGIAIFLVASSLLIAGAPILRPPAPALPASKSPSKAHPFALSTAVPLVPIPTEQLVQSEMAQVIPAPPGVAYAENEPDFPIPVAADPYVTPSAQPFASVSRRLRPPTTRRLPGSRALAVPQLVQVGGPNVTGINPYWQYEGDGIAGVGSYMVNVATGNLIVQSGDMSVPHKGLNLAFHRVYNSYSTHDYANTDGSVMDNYGDGWTNTYDIHVAKNSLSGGAGISVFDATGARFDYTKDCSTSPCTFVPPPGQHAVLTLDSSTGQYYWTTTSGVVFLFHNPTDTTSGVAGRLVKIWGRNNNTKVYMVYFFDQGFTDGTHLNKITVNTEVSGGLQLASTLNFSDVVVNPGGPNASTHRLLTSLVWPDNTTTIVYHYDTSGRLIQVDEPTNNTVNASIPQVYQYSGTGYLLNQAMGGRWNLSVHNSDGGYTQFTYSGSSVSAVSSYGWINPTIPDGVSGTGPLQSGYSSEYLPPNPYRNVTFTYDTPALTGFSCPAGTTGDTQWSDTAGRGSIYCWDGSNRVDELQAKTGDASGPTYLITKLTWDTQSNLITVVDPRLQETDFAYDANGNLIAKALPPASSGAYRPTTYLSYDANNNPTSVCDPASVHAAQRDWTATPLPQDTLCNGIANSKQYTWTVPSPAPSAASYEAFGELTKVTTPLGYNATISYNPALQNSQQTNNTTDYGLPTSVTGDSITQMDRSVITPQTNITYDAFGHIVCRGNAIGLGVIATMVIQYDPNNLGRVTAVADPDDGSLLSCGKTSNSKTVVSYQYYFPNGQVQKSESPAQHATGTGAAFTYDADGDETSEMRHFGTATPAPGASPPVKLMWYDASDRLVEVAEPRDATNDYFSYAWLTRYLYDLTQNGTQGSLQFGGTGIGKAYGHLFKKQEYVGATQTGSPTWTDISGNNFDALSRPLTKYYYSPGSSTVRTTTATYDATQSAYGLASSRQDALAESEAYVYDNIGRLSQTSFSNDGGVTPSESYVYDPDGRPLTITSSVFGAQQYTYDAAGNVLTSTEPTQGGVTSPSVITYQYYPTGARKSLSVAPETGGGLSQTNLFTYDYRADGLSQTTGVNYAGTSPAIASSFTGSYAPSGRLTSEADPYYPSAVSITYDSFDRPSSYSIPEGTYGSISYDPEGETVSYTAYAGETLTNTFSDRGELVSQAYSPNQSSWPLLAQKVANGLPLVTTDTIDTRTGANLGIGSYSGGDGAQWSFDAAGRQVSGQDAVTWTIPPVGGGGDVTVYGSMTRSYDAENHIIGMTTDPWYFARTRSCGYSGKIGGYPPHLVATVGYKWGPNGHPIMQGIAFGSGTTATPPPTSAIAFRTIHWDGDQILFTSDAAGQIEDIKVGTTADITPNDSTFKQLSVWDRDSNGQIAGAHNSSQGFSAWTPPNPYRENCTASGAPGPSGTFTMPSGFAWYPGQGQPTTSLLIEPATDGFYDGFNVIQGVRSFAPDAGTWTTQDPVAGDTDNPASQKPYVYDAGNPERYSDPTGSVPMSPYVYAGDMAFMVAMSEPPLTPWIIAARREAKIKDLLGQAMETAQHQMGLQNAPTTPNEEKIFLALTAFYFDRLLAENENKYPGITRDYYLTYREDSSGDPYLQSRTQGALEVRGAPLPGYYSSHGVVTQVLPAYTFLAEVSLDYKFISRTYYQFGFMDGQLMEGPPGGPWFAYLGGGENK